jgi:hypothetical protein
MDEQSSDDPIRQVPIRDLKIDPTAEDLTNGLSRHPALHEPGARRDGAQRPTSGGGRDRRLASGGALHVARSVPRVDETF